MPPSSRAIPIARAAAAGPPRSRLARYSPACEPKYAIVWYRRCVDEQRLARADHEAERGRSGRREARARPSRARRGPRCPPPRSARRRPARGPPRGSRPPPRDRTRGAAGRAPGSSGPSGLARTRPPGGRSAASSRTRRTACVSSASLRIVSTKRPPAGGPAPMASTSRASSTRAIEAEKPSAAGRPADPRPPGRRWGTSRSSSSGRRRTARSASRTPSS